MLTSEEAVRGVLAVDDPQIVPTSLVVEALEEAEAMLRARLRAETLLEPLDVRIVHAATVLAAALVLESLAANQAATRYTVTVGGQRLETHQRFSALLSAALQYEKRAWRLLEPFTSPLPRAGAVVTESQS